MKFIKPYLLELVGAAAALLIIAYLLKGATGPSFGSEAVSFGDGWDVEVGGRAAHYAALPARIEDKAMEPVALRKELPYPEDEGKAVGFFTSHQNISVYIEGELVHSFWAAEGGISKTPGNGWNLVPIKKEQGGKELCIVLEPAYPSSSGVIPEFLYGDRDAILIGLVKEELPAVFLCVQIFLMGVGLLFATLFFHKTLRIPSVSLWLGLFAIFLATWSGLETQMFPVFFGNHLFFNQLTFISLKLVYVPIMIFLRYTYNLEDNRFLDGLCVASLVEFAACLALQLFGILDFRETIGVTHIIFVVGALWLLRLTAGLMKTGDDTQKKLIRYHIIGLGAVAVSVLLESVGFYLNSSDSARFVRIGFFIYIIILVIMLLNNSIQLIRMGEEAEAYKKVAYQDALTKLSNRNAFEEDLEKLPKAQWGAMSAVMLDLNNLKYFNDLYGHSVGDYYIVTCSQSIRDVFGRAGTVYRIGGDEFCALLKHTTQEEYEEMRRELEEMTESFNDEFSERRMSVASGYACYDERLDRTFQDTIRRADENMYQCKEEMKRKASEDFARAGKEASIAPSQSVRSPRRS